MLKVRFHIVIDIYEEIKGRLTIAYHFSITDSYHRHRAVRVHIDVWRLKIFILDRIDQGKVELGLCHVAND